MSANNEDIEEPLEESVEVEKVEEQEEKMEKPRVKKARSQKQIDSLKKEQ